jgi:hypothetical protein
MFVEQRRSNTLFLAQSRSKCNLLNVMSAIIADKLKGAAVYSMADMGLIGGCVALHTVEVVALLPHARFTKAARPPIVGREFGTATIATENPHSFDARSRSSLTFAARVRKQGRKGRRIASPALVAGVSPPPA